MFRSAKTNQKEKELGYFIVRFETRNPQEDRYLRSINFYDHEVTLNNESDFIEFQKFILEELIESNENDEWIKQSEDIILPYPLNLNKKSITGFVALFNQNEGCKIKTNFGGYIKIRPGIKYIIRLPENYKNIFEQPKCSNGKIVDIPWNQNKTEYFPICVQEIDIMESFKKYQKITAKKIYDALESQIPKEIAGLISEYTI